MSKHSFLIKLTNAEAYVLQCHLYEEYPAYVGRAENNHHYQQKLRIFEAVYSQFRGRLGPWDDPLVASRPIKILINFDELEVLTEVVSNLRVRAIGLFKLTQVEDTYLSKVESCFAKIKLSLDAHQVSMARAKDSYISPFTGETT